MSSRLIKYLSIYSFFFVILVFSIYGCYTSFTHPPIQDYQWGSVHLSDDCLECHEHNQFAAPILPDAAEHDYSWQFYSGSAWWQDEMTIAAGVAVNPDDRTGPRSVTTHTMSPAPVAMPVQGMGQSLGKKTTDDQNSEPDQERKRTVGRRSHTKSSSGDSSTGGSNSRARN